MGKTPPFINDWRCYISAQNVTLCGLPEPRRAGPFHCCVASLSNHLTVSSSNSIPRLFCASRTSTQAVEIITQLLISLPRPGDYWQVFGGCEWAQVRDKAFWAWCWTGRGSLLSSSTSKAYYSLNFSSPIATLKKKSKPKTFCSRQGKYVCRRNQGVSTTADSPSRE